jgi:hypothetical protein
MKNLRVICLLLNIAFLLTTQSAYATKTAPALPVQITASTASVALNGAVEYLVHIPNKSSSSYWGVTATATFPQSVSCTHIVSQSRGGCTLSGNKLSCYWADFYDWWVVDVKVACTAVACGTAKSVASINVNKPAQSAASEANVNVTCAAQVQTECNDGQDNDGDGKVDLSDPDCSDSSDNSERGVTVYTPQCRDGVDNDGDGKIDALVQSAGNGAAQATIASGDPHSYIPGFNTRAAQSGVGAIRDAALFDQGTAQKICQVMGYTTVVSVDSRHNDGRNGFTSPGNNTLSRWNPATNSFDYLNAKAAGNRWIATLVCGGTPASCSNGKDDDGDGLTDFPADNGCASATDSSERPHDPGCSNPDDNDERDSLNQCEDGLDNDADGRIDFPSDLGCTSPTDNNEGDEPACQDGRDNDGDGKVDSADPGCSNPNDNNETDDPQCSDSRDNDGDGRTDLADAGCDSPSDNNEGDEAQCKDGRDNDGDGRTDFPADAGCDSATDNNEGDEAQCKDGRDNDSDGRTDFPADAGCSNANDTNEGDELACQDGRDNDADGKVDLADPGCDSATDNNEADEPQCKDGRDNDGDSKTDLADPGCESANDNNEGDEPACKDGRDNDGDGKTDFPSDAGCTSLNDTDETGEPDCADGRDNDGDGWIDFPEDGGCSSKDDTSERDPYGPQCDNGIDDDSDGKIDFPNDSDCTGPKDLTEATQCSDKKDNDSDGLIDMQDPGCANPQDDNESDEPQCADRKDNDGDGKIDLQDLGCKDASDNNESDEPKLQCADGKDNDNDGKIDFPADPGCTTISDDNEGDEPKFQCSDKIDNDGDGWIDFPEDTGCTSAEDNDESNPINPITPTVSCLFDNGDGSSTAFFGYENSSSQVVEIAAGTNDRVNINAFSPGAANQGQPSSFKPGKSVAAFSVLVWNAEPVTWTTMVNGSAKNSVTAKKGVSKDCAPLIPILECVDQKSSSQFTARFGYDNQNGFEVPLPIGQYNKFSPGAQDRGQPNKFFSGVVKTAFMVDFSGQDLTWQLAAQSATASEHSKPCNPNTVPVCNAGGPYAKACQGTETKITLDGSASQDPEGKTLTYKWSSSCSNITIDNATSATPIITLTGPGLGEPAQCSVSLTVNDGVKSSSCEAPVEVPACSSDCNNKPGGSAQVDICGVCGGDGTSCLGCDGVPNSGAALDKCGVCGGNNSCVGCDGVPNSGKVNDACGVCGGDGQTCVQCTESDIMQTLFAMDNNAKKQEANSLQILRRLSRQAKDQKTKQLAEQGRIEANKLNSLNWQLTWSLPQVIKTCPESSACSTSDNSITISSYNTNAASFRDLSQQALRELARVLGGSLRPDDKKLGVAADRLYNEAVATADTVPRFQSVCQ